MPDSPVPGSDPDVSRPRLMRNASFLEADRREIALRRGRHNQLGFAYQVAFVRVLGRFPQQAPLEIDGEILRFAALQLGADAETIHAYAGRQQTVSDHQHRIGEHLRLGAFDAAGQRTAGAVSRRRSAPARAPHHARNRPAARPYAARVRSFVDRGREELQKSLDGHYSVITASRMAAVSSPPNLELNTVMPTKLNPGGNSLSSLSNVPVRLVASRT